MIHLVVRLKLRNEWIFLLNYTHMLQEQNSSSFNSQKENMMLEANLATNLETSNVKNVVKTQTTDKLTDAQKADKVKQSEVVEQSKRPSFNRTLEAYSDCV